MNRGIGFCGNEEPVPAKQRGEGREVARAEMLIVVADLMQMLQLARNPGAANTVIDTLRQEHFRRVSMNLSNAAERGLILRGPHTSAYAFNPFRRDIFMRRDQNTINSASKAQR